VRRRSIRVEVEPGESGDPRVFIRSGRSYAVTEVLSAWREAGVWWRTAEGSARLDVAQDAGRRVWRVEAVPVRGGSAVVVDLAWEPSGWFLSQVVD
jgi:hypothetical protein